MLLGYKLAYDLQRVSEHFDKIAGYWLPETEYVNTIELIYILT